jgi:hypothetical protein
VLNIRRLKILQETNTLAYFAPTSALTTFKTFATKAGAYPSGAVL